MKIKTEHLLYLVLFVLVYFWYKDPIRRGGASAPGVPDFDFRY